MDLSSLIKAKEWSRAFESLKANPALESDLAEIRLLSERAFGVGLINGAMAEASKCRISFESNEFMYDPKSKCVSQVKALTSLFLDRAIDPARDSLILARHESTAFMLLHMIVDAGRHIRSFNR